MEVYVSICIRAKLPEETRGVESLELELQAVSSCLTWVLETEPQIPVRAAHALTVEHLSDPRAT